MGVWSTRRGWGTEPGEKEAQVAGDHLPKPSRILDSWEDVWRGAVSTLGWHHKIEASAHHRSRSFGEKTLQFFPNTPSIPNISNAHWCKCPETFRHLESLNLSAQRRFWGWQQGLDHSAGWHLYGGMNIPAWGHHAVPWRGVEAPEGFILPGRWTNIFKNSFKINIMNSAYRAGMMGLGSG